MIGAKKQLGMGIGAGLGAHGSYSSGVAAYTLAFSALTFDASYEMQGVKTGTGDLTTTHTSDIYGRIMRMYIGSLVKTSLSGVVGG